jgi:hypothetical protein
MLVHQRASILSIYNVRMMKTILMPIMDPIPLMPKASPEWVPDV